MCFAVNILIPQSRDSWRQSFFHKSERTCSQLREIPASLDIRRVETTTRIQYLDEGGMDWEFRISRCRLIHIEGINNKVLLWSTGNYTQFPVISHNGKEYEKEYILWLPDAKSRLIRKDPDAGQDWRQQEKGMTEDEMVGWHHWLSDKSLSKLWGWRTREPGMLQSMDSQRVRHNLVTEQQIHMYIYVYM